MTGRITVSIVHYIDAYIAPFRKELADIGFEGNIEQLLPEIHRRFGEGSRQLQMARMVARGESILTWYEKLKAQGHDVEPLIEDCFWWGWYRGTISYSHTVDPLVGATTEQLARERWKARNAYQNENEGRDDLNRRRRREKERWWSVAREIAGQSTTHGGALEKFVQKELQRRGVSKSTRSIRRALTGK